MPFIVIKRINYLLIFLACVASDVVIAAAYVYNNGVLKRKMLIHFFYIMSHSLRYYSIFTTI